jgi:uncharacterized membrane protein YeaQ/YmgE (transglycosylase-associated protein family)
MAPLGGILPGCFSHCPGWLWGLAPNSRSAIALSCNGFHAGIADCCRRIIMGRLVMTIEALIIWLVIGAIAGWLAGLIMKGYGFGLIGNIVVGIVGAFVAGWLLPRIGFVLVGGFVAEIVNAVIGAVILLLVIGLAKKGV